MDLENIIKFIELVPKNVDRFPQQIQSNIFRTILFEMLESFDKIFHFKTEISLILKFPDFCHSKMPDLIPFWKKKLEPILNKVNSGFIDPKIYSQPTKSDDHILDEIKEALKVCDYILDFLWELLHTGKWYQVPMAVRKMFAFHCWIESLLKLSRIQSYNYCPLELLENSLNSIDRGLIMGSDLKDNLLVKCAEFLHKILIIFLEKFNHECSNYQMSFVWLNLMKMIAYFDKHEISPAPIGFFSEPDSVENGLELNKFENDYFRKSNPLVIRNGMHDWPCRSIRQWNLRYLLRSMAFRLVPVEIGKKYTEENLEQKLMSVHKFVQEFIIQRNEKMGYMAQHNLFDLCSELAKDICIPDLCAISDQNLEPHFEINAWFGPSGTVSPLHYDSKNNILCQIIGTKYIRLYSDKLPADYIYPFPEESYLFNTSRVDVENVDNSLYPNFNKIDHQYVWECFLNEGDMLFIPKDVWHFVKASTYSFSVNFWWK